MFYMFQKKGETFPGPVVGANEQGPAGMHICFNLAPNVDSKEFIIKLKEQCKGMQGYKCSSYALLSMLSQLGNTITVHINIFLHKVWRM